MSRIDVICDHSQQDLKVVPLRVLEMCNLQMLYLEGNGLEALPTNIFQKLPKLIWLDLRNNKLRDIPTGIANHAWLENLLLEQNNLERLPNELGLVPKLVVLQLSKNPLIYPSKDIISQGIEAITSYLRNEYNKENGLPLELGNESTASDKDKKAVKRKKKVVKEKIDIRELLRKSSHHSRLSMEHMPTISIKSLSAEACNVIKNDDAVKSVVCAIHSPRYPPKAIRDKETTSGKHQRREQSEEDIGPRTKSDLDREIERTTRRARKASTTRKKPSSPQLLEINAEARTTERNKSKREASRSAVRHKSRLRKNAVKERSDERCGEDRKETKECAKEELRSTKTYQRTSQPIKSAGSSQRNKSDTEQRNRKKRKRNSNGKLLHN
ncbi:leucine rich repeat containing protein [Holotrichia oblita]|uniref:Leucine rich repeat containing protein n=1 Tax=Holotrichia oblita TaxID=644536 RepID=A0ACB9T580_HOLOL|nr:leucine rich repeat containing protein [Holotrichia oblita]